MNQYEKTSLIKIGTLLPASAVEAKAGSGAAAGGGTLGTECRMWRTRGRLCWRGTPPSRAAARSCWQNAAGMQGGVAPFAWTGLRRGRTRAGERAVAQHL